MDFNHIVFFDTETTGANTAKDRIIQLSAVKCDLQLNIVEKKLIVVNPQMPIPAEASAIHKITDANVVGKPIFREYAAALLQYFTGVHLGGYNVKRFDIPLLHEEFARCNMKWDLTDVKVLDACRIFFEKEKRDLSAAMKFYCNIDGVDGGAHDAENDTLASIKVANAQMNMYQMNLHDAFDYPEDKNVDLAGCIVLNDAGVPVYGIGKDKGKEIRANPGFALWMLNQDFTSDTKEKIKIIINKK